MDELKPCPFCGGEAEVVYGWNDGEPTHIECMGCGALVDTAEVWNTRAERTCHNISEDGFLCSVCSFGDFGSFKFEPNYCPSCGAKVVDA